jgi:fermentation-respiration switch protein FrsA (DUF1100 family)
VAALSPIPLLLIHGERDAVVPAHHSQLLFDAAQAPKDFWTIPDSGHIQAVRSAKVRQRLTAFLVQHSVARLPEAPKRASADDVDVRVR